jgi:serine/alanine adding enzyme
MSIPGPGIETCAEVEPERWDAALRAAGVTDVYYARGFVAASAALAGAEPLLLRHRDVFFACLLRSDPADVVTPYGYGGPVGEPLDEFPAAYEAWCAQRGVVSSFAVFHPLLRNGGPPFRRTPLAGTVAWDLVGGADLEAGMHRHHRRLVRRARAAGHEPAIERAPRDLGGFVPLYEQTMRRAGAAPFYFFAPAYWEALARDVPLVRADVRDAGGELVASALGMGEPPWLHYHLGAAAEAARGSGASQLALLALAEWGRASGYETLHLGGGVGGRADSLLEYKLRFAPDGLIASEIGKAVHDEAAYLRLSGGAAIDWDGFFPAYRQPR